MRREDLFSHYERELLYLRRAGEGFSRAYPKVAKRLALGPEQAGDPHVERLIESFAFLTSRLQLNLDRQFPVFTEGLLNILYPHLAKPVPSCGIAMVRVDPEAGEMTEGYILPRGTELIASAGDDARCRFTTSTDLELWPVALTATATVPTDKTPFADETVVNGALRIDIEALGGTPLEALEMRRLRVFINAEPSVSAAVYEALTTQVLQAAYVSEDGTVRHVRAGVHAQPAHFCVEDPLLPVPSNSHPAYGLLQDVFIFPQKFLFIDITVPAAALSGDRGSIFLGLGQPLPERMRIRPDTLLLGCVPIVNLFRRYAEPIRVDQRKTAYLVSPDALRDRITEVWAVDSVAGIKDDGERTPYVRLFSAEHALAGAEPEAFWFTRTEPSLRGDRGGTETWLSVVDLNMDPMRPAAETLLVHTLCTNRGLAEEVPAKAALMLEEPAPVGTISLLYKPTMPRYRDGSGETAWRLISQLSLNHLSLVSGPEALRALQEILMLHAMDDPAARVQISALRELTVRPIVQRVGQDAWRGFCRGLQVTIDVDERGFVGASPLVFGEVLSRFLGLYAAVNSFVQLRVPLVATGRRLAHMAVHFRRPARPLIEDLRAEPYKYELFQAIAILERVRRDSTVPLGTGIDPEVEAVRLEQDPGLNFPASDIASAGETTDGTPILRTPVIGVSGLNGPLPYAFTESMIERMARRDLAMAAFMNIFNHRIVSLLYRIRATTMPLLDGRPADTEAARALRSFIGIHTPGLQERLPDVPDRALMGFAAIFADKRRSAEGLRVVLAGIFNVDVSVRSFVGRWLELEPDTRTRLAPDAPEQARTLGGGAVLGRRVWDQHGAFGIHMRFDSLERFEAFLPSGEHHKALLSVCRFYAGDVCDVVRDLSLAAPAVPPLRISARDSRARLGWTTWLLGASGKARTDGAVRLVSKVTETAGP